MARGHRIPPRARRLIAAAVLAVAVGAAAGCGSSDADDNATNAEANDATTTASTPDESVGDDLFPDVVDVDAQRAGDGTWTFAVTLSSPYDTPARYADAWRIRSADGAEYGVRELAHDHQNEQPFTRSLSGVELPDSVTTVIVEGRDQRNGWGGATVEFRLP